MNFGTVRVPFYLTQLVHLMILGFALPFISQAQEQEFRFQSVGARIGFPAESTSNHFRQADAFLNYNLWRWNLGRNWQLQSRVGASAGWLGQRGDNAFIGTVGPVLEISHVPFPLSLETGFSPTYISRYHFGSTDLGTTAQFTSHIGLNWDVSRHWRLGYRFQHMSNGGIKVPNPGFNVHVISIGYLF
jgi:Lipid A 3-O-deacylase (PagL)